MNPEPVKSSVIASIGYDAEAEILEVEFHSRRRYRYFGVPPSVHRELLEADSIGAFFNTVIKPNYEVREVT